MNYIYHAVPEQMSGHELIALNQMKTSLPDLFNTYVQKYNGREEILERKIPLLNCLWNDVVQFLPLHPRTVFELQKELGLIEAVPEYRYFQIDITKLDPSQTVVYFKTAPGEEHTSVKWLQDADFSALQSIPAATINYYQSLQGTGEAPFNYQFIPHILSLGPVDISNATIITL